VNDEGKCIQIVSQSSLLAFVAAHKEEEELKEELSRTFEVSKLGLKKVVTVDENSTAKEAFQLIERSNLSGIGVVDEDGNLIGNTSARDIKYFVLDQGQAKIDQPILDYLAIVRSSVKTAKEKVPVSTVHATDPIGRAIGLLAKTQFHRLFIVDSESKPIGVVSVADILGYISLERK